MGYNYNPNIPHLQGGYTTFTNHLLTSWDIQVILIFKQLEPMHTILIHTLCKTERSLFNDLRGSFSFSCCRVYLITFRSSCTPPEVPVRKNRYRILLLSLCVIHNGLMFIFILLGFQEHGVKNLPSQKLIAKVI